MESTFLLIGGVYNILSAVFHLLFWRLFRWNADLRSLTPVNRAIMQVLNLCLIFVFLIFAGVSIGFPESLQTTGLGKFMLWSIAIFWFARAIEQVLFFDRRSWLSVVLVVVFLIGGALYMIPAVGR